MTPASKSVDLSELGQLFMAGLPGTVVDDSTRRLIQNFGINNFIYFSRNVENPEQIRQLSKDLCLACKESGLAPPLIAIDQEGGSVTRLPEPFSQFPDANILAGSTEPEKALSDYARVCSRELRSIGVNYNLAPVLDVCAPGREYFMEKRSLGGNPENVGQLGRVVIRELQANGIGACAKHFPGLGTAIVDPHFQLPFVTKTEACIRSEDLPPFQEAIAIGVASIMTSHTIYNNLDPENPATLSKKILTGLLRHDLGYEGVVITDDLEMGAIEQESDVGHAAVQAFAAGADLLLICKSHQKVIDAYNKTARAVDRDPELAGRMAASLQRLSQMRQRFAPG